jgi:hypothetical protein
MAMQANSSREKKQLYSQKCYQRSGGKTSLQRSYRAWTTDKNIHSLPPVLVVTPGKTRET